jgi:hypothetical protein
MQKRLSVFVLLLSAFSVFACDDKGSEPTTPPACSNTASSAWLAGRWVITGSGTRTSCQNEKFNQPFGLNTSFPLEIEAVEPGSRGKTANTDGGVDAAFDAASDGLSVDGPTGDGPRTDGVVFDGALFDGPTLDGSLDSISPGDGSSPDRAVRPASFELVARSAPAGFTFNGKVRGTCVEFTTEEQTADGIVRYTFVGKAEGGDVVGRFYGTSPGGCRAEGSFVVKISLDPDPYRQPTPKRDAGPKRDAPACVPKTCVAGLSCGDFDDGCGRALRCGSCARGTCGGGGTPNVCGCIATASLGPISAGTGVNDRRLSGNGDWSRTTEISTLDASGNSSVGAAKVAVSAPETSNLLVATGFKLAVPKDAFITGIEVAVRRRAQQSTGNLSDGRVSLLGNDRLTESTRAKTTPWTDQWSIIKYGDPQDLWGRPWTVNDVNSSDFGAALSVRSADRFLASGWVDHVSVTIHYADSCPVTPTPDGGSSDGSPKDAGAKDASVKDALFDAALDS